MNVPNSIRINWCHVFSRSQNYSVAACTILHSFGARYCVNNLRAVSRTEVLGCLKLTLRNVGVHVYRNRLLIDGIRLSRLVRSDLTHNAKNKHRKRWFHPASGLRHSCGGLDLNVCLTKRHLRAFNSIYFWIKAPFEMRFSNKIRVEANCLGLGFDQSLAMPWTLPLFVTWHLTFVTAKLSPYFTSVASNFWFTFFHFANFSNQNSPKVQIKWFQKIVNVSCWRTHSRKHSRKCIRCTRANRCATWFWWSIAMLFGWFHSREILISFQRLTKWFYFRISAHRNVLAASSEYFYGMFVGDMAERDAPEIALKDITGDGLKPLIDSCYTGWIDLDKENVYSVLAAASHLRFEEIEKKCAQYLKKHLTTSTCLEIHAVSERFSLTELSTAAMDHIAENFVTIAATEEFCQLSKGQLLQILKNSELDVNSEEDFVKAIISWVQNDQQNRTDLLPDLVKLIRFGQLEKTVSGPID